MQHPALTVSIGIADQTNEQEAKKQGAEEIISAILIGDDAEICALLFTGQLQVDLIVGGDIPHLMQVMEEAALPCIGSHARG